MGALSRTSLNVRREEVAHWLIGLRQRTVEATRTDQPLQPLMAEQQAFVLSMMTDVAAELAVRRRIEPAEVIVYEAGAFSKGTCTIGSDLDLNVAAFDMDAGYGFEQGIRKTLAFLLNIRKSEIHNNDLNLASHREKLRRELPLDAQLWRRRRRGLIFKAAQHLFQRGVYRIFGKDTLDFVVWAAIRHPQLILASGLHEAQLFAAGDPWGGVFFDKTFIFGNELIFREIMEEIEGSIDQDAVVENRAGLLSGLVGKTSSIQRPDFPDVVEECKDLEQAQHFIKHDGGYKTALQLLFVLASMGGESMAGENNRLGYYQQSAAIEEVLGDRLRGELLASIDWLFKARAVISIYANDGPNNPTMRSVSKSPDFSGRWVQENVLAAMGADSFADFLGAIADQRAVIQRAIGQAQGKGLE
ncbi:MAG: hypothetical protein ABH823_02025 [bacterium]